MRRMQNQPHNQYNKIQNNLHVLGFPYIIYCSIYLFDLLPEVIIYQKNYIGCRQLSHVPVVFICKQKHFCAKIIYMEKILILQFVSEISPKGLCAEGLIPHAIVFSIGNFGM
jgi:hypothetical protein